MTRRKPSADEIHDEILRHLESHPPVAKREEKAKAAAKSRPRKTTSRPAKRLERTVRPTLMLRRLRQPIALERLAHFVQYHAQRGTAEILVIVGKGKSSPDGVSVLGPAVRAWCASARLVENVEVAPLHEGGIGALILRLKAPA